MADRDDLRFRLDWPEDDTLTPRSDDQLSDFSFEWDEAPADAAALVEAGEPEPEPFSEPAPAVTSTFAPPPAAAPTPSPVAAPSPAAAFEAPQQTERYDLPLVDANDALETVRVALNQQNTVLMQLSDAVYELASNVRALVDAVEAELSRPPVDLGGNSGAVGDVAASAMVTMGSEVTNAVEKLSGEIAETKSELRGLMDDLVAAASGHGPGTGGASRLAVELGRVQSELQALKRRIPVRGKELDAHEIADIVSDAVLIALAGEVPAPRPRARRTAAAPAAAPAADRSKRQRPLRAD